ncbi:RDD family protein [Ornithinimicrobium pekingense]|uniref:RDD domain-containing protein n=1 Tax=Ornithinimicrobium pekingense TaxID=384677 RepID=A0ABQ2F5G4_9MICO|nr:RDD family protein [Ornithinimicrobium pekingense]GGK62477.1 hypothetical protein GCM10011509_08570 [Ornithinimicrobium pekingense]
MPSAPALTTWRPSPAARVRSWLGDWLVVAGWLALLTLLGVLVRPLLDVPGPAGAPGPRRVLAADLAISLVTVVPYVLYLFVTESSPRSASLGKRWAGLVVAGATGGPARTGQVFARNVVKALPWQVAHLGVSRAVLEVQLPIGMTLVVLSLVLAAACMVPSLVGGRGLHDRVAGTRVQRASRSGPVDR